jgi:hypothetical protein
VARYGAADGPAGDVCLKHCGLGVEGGWFYWPGVSFADGGKLSGRHALQSFVLVSALNAAVQVKAVRFHDIYGVQEKAVPLGYLFEF